jgi:RNA recognition motif-containing protein
VLASICLQGFGFVQFEDRSAVTRALQELDGKEVRGRPMRVTRALDEEDAKEEDHKRLKKGQSVTCFLLLPVV